MIKGHVDRLDHTRVEGWIWDDAAPDRRVEIEILDGQDVLARMRAERLRPDLARAGLGDGHYGFSLIFPAGLLAMPVHRISVRVAQTGQVLDNSPGLVFPPNGGAFDHLSEWFLKRVSDSTDAAVEPAQLEPLFALCVTALSRVMSAEHRLLEQKAITPNSNTDQAALPARLKFVLERALETLPLLMVPGFAQPSLSIIISAEANLVETHQLLKSIISGGAMRRYEIIVIDGSGGSDLVVLPLLVKGAGIRIVKPAARLSDLRAFDLGASMARGEDLVFLGRVATVEPGAIAALQDTLALTGETAIIGARLLTRDGRIIEAGTRLEPMAERFAFGRYDGKDTPRHRVLRPSDDVSARAFALRRKVYDACGGFTLSEPMGAFAMTDFCLRWRDKGGRVMVQGYAGVVVNEGAPRAAEEKGDRLRFLHAWSRKLPGVKSSAESAALTPKRALVIDELWPDPERDAASVAVISHCESLLRLGYQVEFLATSPQGCSEADAYHLFLRGILPVTGQEGVEAYLSSREGQFALVYVHRFESARSFLAACRSSQPKAVLLYNVADLHYLRLRRQAEIEANEARLSEAAVIEAEEKRCLSLADCVITHSSDEVDIIKAAAPTVRVAQVLWSYPQAGTVAPFAGRKDLAFLGGYLHAPNGDAVRHFTADLWPALRVRLAEANFQVAGSHIEAANFGALGERVILRGHVSDIAGYFAGLRLSLAPLRYGAGVKGKVLLSLAHGLPCIMSPVAAEGMNLPDGLTTQLVAHDDAEFIEKTAHLYAEEGAWQQASDLALAFAKAHISPDAVDRQMREALGL